MNLNGKVVNLAQLQAEMVAAGIDVPALGTAGDDLFTYDAAGEPIDVPASVAPILAAHAPPAPPPIPDFGGDASVASQIADGVTQLRAYLALSSPTAAQSSAALKLLIRGFLFLLRRTVL